MLGCKFNNNLQFTEVHFTTSFQAPERPEGLGDRNPREDMPFCMQYNRENEIIGLEDCLYLNVYVPVSIVALKIKFEIS